MVLDDKWLSSSSAPVRSFADEPLRHCTEAGDQQHHYDAYTDPSCLLYHLKDLALNGASSCEGADFASTFDVLQKCFREAQVRSQSRLDAGAWADDKVERKLRWVAMGVAPGLIVPTLFSCALALDSLSGRSSGRSSPEFEWTEDGGFGPRMEGPTRTLSPSDVGCEPALLAALLEHGSVVIKPTTGTQCAGTLVLSLEDRPPVTHIASANGEPRRNSAARQVGPNSPPRSPPQRYSPLLAAHAAGSVWAFAPVKNECVPRESVSCYDRAPGSGSLGGTEWFDACVRTRHSLCGPQSRFLCEPALAHDQELSVLAINGGRVQVLAGRANCMERLLMLEDHTTLVASSDFAPPSCCRHVLSAKLRGEHTAMVLQQRVLGDEAGRALHVVIREAVATIGRASGAAAFRVDFFVRWGDGGGAALLHLNEVEHGFNAGLAVAWFGLASVDLALRAWALGGDGSQRERFESEMRVEGARQRAASAPGADAVPLVEPVAPKAAGTGAGSNWYDGRMPESAATVPFSEWLSTRASRLAAALLPPPLPRRPASPAA